MTFVALFNFLVWCGSALDTSIAQLEVDLSGGLCCGRNACFADDEHLWQLYTQNTTTPIYDTLRETADISYKDCRTNSLIISAVYWSLVISAVLMALIHVISVFHSVICYRKHMLRFYKGDREFLSKFEPGPFIALTDCLKYASYQVRT